jgi:hypothetical protein
MVKPLRPAVVPACPSTGEALTQFQGAVLNGGSGHTLITGCFSQQGTRITELNESKPAVNKFTNHLTQSWIPTVTFALFHRRGI